jgi:amidohydrolase
MDWETLELELINFRKRLHKFPELSGKEKVTANRMVDFARRFYHGEILTKLGGNGVAIVFEGMAAGKTILIRCDLDALPIQEVNEFDYTSVYPNVSHKCGHDGHMAIVSGLVPLLVNKKIPKGKVVLLFQPAEETGEGANRVLQDPRFAAIVPDYVFALHNLPGFPVNEIVVKENVFASSSRGLIIKLTGKSSHAAEPEKGITPSIAVAELIQLLTGLPTTKTLKDFSLVTIIHARIGERAFGTTPGYAELMATLRSNNEDDMQHIRKQAEKFVSSVALKHKLKYEIEWVEEFPATVNDPLCVNIIRSGAEQNHLTINEISEPFRWSEDFGHFTQKFKGAMFGIGAGTTHPELHHPDYDFPDEIIVTGTKMFYSIIKKVLS